MRFLFDTNAIITLIGKKSDLLTQRVLDSTEGDITVSSIVMYELYFGAYKSTKTAFNLETLRLLFSDFITLDFDREDARAAGEIRSQLARKGIPIGPYDALIAGQAKARKLILVTNNAREFECIHDLQVQDWTQAKS
jgi:tRNA(fMet)-specific endonuclease VapC